MDIQPADLIVPLGLVAGGLFLGLVFEAIVLRRFRDRLSRTR